MQKNKADYVPFIKKYFYTMGTWWSPVYSKQRTAIKPFISKEVYMPENRNERDERNDKMNPNQSNSEKNKSNERNRDDKSNPSERNEDKR